MKQSCSTTNRPVWGLSTLRLFEMKGSIYYAGLFRLRQAATSLKKTDQTCFCSHHYFHRLEFWERFFMSDVLSISTNCRNIIIHQQHLHRQLVWHFSWYTTNYIAEEIHNYCREYSNNQSLMHDWQVSVSWPDLSPLYNR